MHSHVDHSSSPAVNVALIALQDYSYSVRGEPVLTPSSYSPLSFLSSGVPGLNGVKLGVKSIPNSTIPLPFYRKAVNADTVLLSA